ncbi:MAG: hypothetical protein ACUVS2_05360 [Candidatus Flexifilum sp.]
MLSIISTTGTSVFGPRGTPLNTAIQDFKVRESRDLAAIASSRTFPGEEIHKQALADLKAKSGDFLRRACAEINAIEGIHLEHGVKLGNEYHFLASQTAAGVLAARVLADYCREVYQASNASVIIIDGLQVDKAQLFRRTGLPYLIQTVYNLLDEAKRKQLKAILNPTGGFKAAIPYLTLVGMLRRTDKVEVSIIHETSPELITLSGLPIALNISEIKQYRRVLEDCAAEQQKGLEPDKLKQGLGLSENEQIEDHEFWSLFEQFDDGYILSGLGSIALQELRSRERLSKVWLSKQAYDRLNEEFRQGSRSRENFEIIFRRIADPDYRVPPYRHEYSRSRFPAYKYKGNERLFYHEQKDGSVLILELALHISDNNWSYDRIPENLENYHPSYEWNVLDQS